MPTRTQTPAAHLADRLRGLADWLEAGDDGAPNHIVALDLYRTADRLRDLADLATRYAKITAPMREE